MAGPIAFLGRRTRRSGRQRANLDHHSECNIRSKLLILPLLLDEDVCAAPLDNRSIAPTLFFSQADNEPTRSIGEACCIRALPQKGR